MKWIIGIVAAAAVVVIALGIWVRLKPVPDSALAFPEVTQGVGDYPSQGGFVAVRTPDDTQAALARLLDAARATPRTDIVSQGDDRFVAITRSLVFGFPDVAHVWAEGDRVIVQSHLVIGKGDAGVNAAKVRGWLERAGL
ncbi:DUF1499 domain-containing protein [Maribius pontilimi]|uniref:DUF1499 domain-containing protein n=1 Tax=Palleronia pontilimi TaxID=1964209 RepID=A0A934IFL6_9RHOB|nr:DUF1499 domain-containing protein [Palleronia pontilimi]MBJ3761705.1 DUF1499 domain-containing protein [Palleronia pontilimi]